MLGAGCVAMCLAVAVTAANSLPETSLTVPPNRHTRVKRCSCNNWMDKECIYFCHLDIIWVNTGSQMLPYGLGSPGRRKKRASARCQCRDVKDKTCNSFCQNTACTLQPLIVSMYISLLRLQYLPLQSWQRLGLIYSHSYRANTDNKPRSSKEIIPVNNFLNMKNSQVHLLRVFRDVAAHNTQVTYARKLFSITTAKQPLDSTIWKRKR